MIYYAGILLSFSAHVNSTRTLTAQTPDRIGQTVTLQGWIDVRRDMGKIIFLHLRDRSGMVQVVCAPVNAPIMKKSKKCGANSWWK